MTTMTTALPATTSSNLLAAAPACVCTGAADECRTLVETLCRSATAILDDVAADPSACAADGWEGQAADLFRERIAALAVRAADAAGLVAAARLTALDATTVTTVTMTATALAEAVP
ncbi:hypothetical protein [Bifidobacterium choloepi]|uniref:Uncharacterized protein n=1 Tax=Bifidobacterium choloepi TaxID=2614131 RepID=A0A6I5NKK7_9BIFI|nr:hypothetical protein [Bifidobacterium choloepi]NEG69382.1 hypothetical protein [Bifidobacterium choloepi]